MEDAYYRLKKISYNGDSDYSNIIFIESAKLNDVVIYPNPTNNFFIINWQSKDLLNATIQLFDLEGSELNLNSYTENEKIIFSVNNFPSGIYIMKFSTDQKVFYRRLAIK